MKQMTLSILTGACLALGASACETDRDRTDAVEPRPAEPTRETPTDQQQQMDRQQPGEQPGQQPMGEPGQPGGMDQQGEQDMQRQQEMQREQQQREQEMQRQQQQDQDAF